MKHEEYAIHCALYKYYRQFGKPNTFLFHPLNRAASPRQGAQAKALGVVAGVPDLVGCVGSQFCGIEVKTEKGYLSASQQNCREAIWAAGGYANVAFGLESGLAILKLRGFI